MKYIFIFMLSLVLSSCGASYQANKIEKDFKGDWTLESVTFPDSSGFFDVQLFDVADVGCFENSEWNFIPNNSSGKFKLDGNACDTTEQKFTWYIDSETVENINPEFLFKVTTGQKAKNVNQGTRLEIKSLSDERMVWEQITTFNGSAIRVQMTFLKL